METSRDQLTILLTQIRNNIDTRIEELASFSQFCGLFVEQFTVLNVFDTPLCADYSLVGFDAVLVGGPSECHAARAFPFCTARSEVVVTLYRAKARYLRLLLWLSISCVLVQRLSQFSQHYTSGEGQR